MTTGQDEAVLACGRDPDAVVDRARAGRGDEHELSCPFCQAAIAAASLSRAAAAELAVDTKGATVPAGLLPRVMRTVWSELRRPGQFPIPTDTGSAFITDLAVSSLVEAALQALPALVVHDCTVVAAEAGSGGLSITVEAAAAYGSDLEQLAQAARDTIAGTLRRQIGAAVSGADITIVDVFVPGDSAAGMAS